MIIDSITGLERYYGISPYFDKVAKFLNSVNISELEEGKHEIDGSNAYLTVTTTQGKNVEEAKLEVHDSYIDIHIPLEGVETFGWRNRAHCSDIYEPYNEANDIAFFTEEADVFFTMEPFSIAIIFPYDAHAPLIGEGPIKKIVVKVKVN